MTDDEKQLVADCSNLCRTVTDKSQVLAYAEMLERAIYENERIFPTAQLHAFLRKRKLPAKARDEWD